MNRAIAGVDFYIPKRKDELVILLSQKYPTDKCKFSRMRKKRLYAIWFSVCRKALLSSILTLSMFFTPLLSGESSSSKTPLCEVPSIASWYGGGEHLNKYTANGEVFNPNDLTCASWDYPFGTLLRVTNVRNNKSVVVRVNDRGPNKTLNRKLDLTKGAFGRIAEVEEGVVKVKIEVVRCRDE